MPEGMLCNRKERILFQCVVPQTVDYEALQAWLFPEV